MLPLIVLTAVLYPYLNDYLKPKPVQLSEVEIVSSLVATNPVYSAMTVIASTPSPTPSPTPTRYSGITIYSYSTPVQSELLMFKLSFYDPAIGKFFPDAAFVNCADWSIEKQECMSSMSNGDDFRKWYGRGVACPPGFALGDIIRVVYPPQLARDWTCVDRGGAIVDGYLDFLLRYPDQVWTGYKLSDFPWSSTVQAYHIKP